MTSIINIPDHPKYTIKNVSMQTGIHPVTLRAWERRYNVLTPHRSNNRYRLYSDRDIAILRWLRARVDSGITISAAVAELKTMIDTGVWPDASPQGLPERRIKPSSPPSKYARDLFQYLVRHDEINASTLMREVLVNFDLKTIALEVVTPCLVEIGEAWYRGEIRITTEHFASAFLRGKLLGLLQAYPVHRTAPYILVGGAPTEEHEIGPLMMALLLRSEGYRVEFLGADLPLEDLVDYAEVEKPAMIILSATTPAAGLEMAGMQKRLALLQSVPVFGYGGRAFNLDPKLRQAVPGEFLGEMMDVAIKAVERLIGPGKTVQKS